MVQIKLEKSFGRLVEKSPFLLVDNEKMTLEFISDIALADCVIEMRNGEQHSKLRARNVRTVEVPKELCAAGELKIVIAVMVQGVAVKKWSVEPIAIVAVDLGFAAYATLNDIHDTVVRVTKTSERIIEKCVEYETRIAELEELVRRIEDY